MTLGNRRCLAAGGLLVAFSLQICGCNPVGDCDLVRETEISSMTWSHLLQQCAQCLSAGEVTILERNKQSEAERSADLGIPDTFGLGQTVREALSLPQELSFYDPAILGREPVSRRLLAGGFFASAGAVPLEMKPLPWPIPESVYFLYSGVRPNGEPPDEQPAATAFVLSVPDRRHERHVRFLVTARHVVDPEWANCSGKNLASIEVRLNRRSGGIGYETIQLESGQQRLYFTPEDGSSDLAVIPLSERQIPKLEEYKFIDIPFRMLPTDSEMEAVQTEQPVMTAGLPAPAMSEAGNYPVFDAGVLSKMPTSSVSVRCGAGKQAQGRALHLWFIHAAVPQGVSGAPVYTALVRGTEKMKTPVLLGVQSVAWPDRGVAGITPAPVLGELIRAALRDSRFEMDLYRGPEP